jgi:endonuclease/exonuclease/phosphatase family metal-dependent hydrolase
MVHECIRRHRPDVVALQELEVADSDSDALYIKEELESAGYEVHAMAKGGGGSGMDGCALAFRRDVFAVPHGDVRKDRLSNRLAQVGVFARLHHRASGRQVVVATTHLKAGPEFERDRQAQMEALLSGVRDAFLPTRGRAAAADIPVVVLGDLNTEPRWELIPGLEAASPVGPLRDAYANNTTTNGPPPGYTDTPFTSYSWFLQGVADYVLHTDGLVPVRVLKVPGTRDVRALYASDYPQRSGGPRFEMLPTKSFPSDHVPLMVEFAFAAPVVDQGLLLPPANDNGQPRTV